jgi:CubicO group peptidase (beta-lactamase class C family)
MDRRLPTGARCQWGYAVLVALAVLYPLSATAQNTLPTARIDSVFIDVDRPGSPGCALGVIRGGTLVYNRGYGYANLDYGIPIDAETVLNIGSVAKHFVAASVLKASLQGHLSLDDDVRKWIPEFPDYGSPITVRHLIHHTGGLRDLAQLLAVGNLPENMTRQEMLALLVRQRALNFAPGEEWLYSNGGYLVLGEILNRAVRQSGLLVEETGAPGGIGGENEDPVVEGIREYLSAEFLRPLGLASAYYGRHPGVVPHASTSYWPADDGFERRYHVGEVVGVRINSLDMARWMVALATDELGPPGFRELQLQRGVLNNGDTTHYAFGLDRLEHRGIPITSHGGGGGGYRTGMAIYHGADLALFAMCNLGTIDALARIRRVAEILLEDRMGPPEPVAAGSRTARNPWPAPPGEPLRLSEAQLSELAGRYFAPELDVVFHILVEGEGLRVGPEGWMRPMVPTAEAGLFSDGRGWAQIRSERDEDGVVTGFIMDIGRVNGLILERIPEDEFRHRLRE